MLTEFYATLDLETLSHDELLNELKGGQDHYNWHRIHGAIEQGPTDKLLDLWDRMPEWV